MQDSLTFKLQSFYVAIAPAAGIWSYGSCFEEAANSLADQLRAIAIAAGERPTGDEKK